MKKKVFHLLKGLKTNALNVLLHCYRFQQTSRCTRTFGGEKKTMRADEEGVKTRRRRGRRGTAIVPLGKFSPLMREEVEKREAAVMCFPLDHGEI